MNNMTQEELELIEQYLTGNLSEPDRAAFEQRMEQDADWRKLVGELRLMAVGIQEAALREKMEEYHQPFTRTTPVVKMNRIKKLVAAAAVLLLILAAGWWWLGKPSAEEQLFADYFRPDPGLPTTMGVSDNYVFDKAMVDYKTGDYQKAISAWEELKKQSPANDTLNYFIGVAALAEKNFDKAIHSLDVVTGNERSVFLAEAYWYKGLSLLHLKRKKEALKALRQSGYPKANELIKKLE